MGSELVLWGLLMLLNEVPLQHMIHISQELESSFPRGLGWGCLWGPID